MKLIYSHPDMSILHLAKNELENNGIESIIKGQYSVGILGAYVGADNWSELWIVDDGQFSEAAEVIEGLFGEEPASE